MTTLTTTMMVPPLRVAPRGAQLVGLVYEALNAVSTRVAALQEARRLQRRAKEAESVRQLARDVLASDPGFASDLFAAADRHYAG